MTFIRLRQQTISAQLSLTGCHPVDDVFAYTEYLATAPPPFPDCLKRSSCPLLTAASSFEGQLYDVVVTASRVETCFTSVLFEICFPCNAVLLHGNLSKFIPANKNSPTYMPLASLVSVSEGCQVGIPGSILTERMIQR
jgi:hypothetical protein